MHTIMPQAADYIFALADILLQRRGVDGPMGTAYEDDVCLITALRDGSDAVVTCNGKDTAGQVVASRKAGQEAFEEGHRLVMDHMEVEAGRCFDGQHVYTFVVGDDAGCTRNVYVRGLTLRDARDMAASDPRGGSVVGLLAAHRPDQFQAAVSPDATVLLTPAAAAALVPLTEVRRIGEGHDNVYWFTYDTILADGGHGPRRSMPIRALDLGDAQGLLRAIRPRRGIRLVRIEVGTLAGFRGFDRRDAYPDLLVSPGILLRDAVETALAARH